MKMCALYGTTSLLLASLLLEDEIRGQSISVCA